MENSIALWTDGSCHNKKDIPPKKRIGGWGCVIVEQSGEKKELCGGFMNATSQRAEMMAVIKGLEHLYVNYVRPLNITVLSDSAYIVNCINDKWYERWMEYDFAGKANEDLWRILLGLVFIDKEIHVSFIHVKGHSGIENNERADRLAFQGKQSRLDKLYAKIKKNKENGSNN